MTAGIGDVVGIYMDTTQRLIPGNYIQTGAGRTYEIITVRVQTRGKHEGRQHLRVMIVPAENAEGRTVTPIRWYSRNRKRR